MKELKPVALEKSVFENQLSNINKRSFLQF